MLIVLDFKNCLKVVVVLISIKFNTRFQYVLNPKMDIPTTQEILLFRLILCAIVLCFGATCVITLFINSFFCQFYAVILLRNCMFETGKESVSEVCISGCRFVCSGICRLCRCMYFLLLILLS